MAWPAQWRTVVSTRLCVPALEEVGVGDAGVGGDGDDAARSGAETAVELEGEHEVGELGLLVGLLGRVAVLVLEIREVELAEFVGDGGDGDDAGWQGVGGGGALEGGEEEGGEGEVAEDVGAELELEAVRGFEALGRGVDAGVVDQEVEGGVSGELAGGKGADAAEGGEVELAELDLGAGDRAADAVDGAFAPCLVAGGDDDGGPVAGELERGGEADAAVGAGDDGAAAGLVGDVGDVPADAHPRLDALRARCAVPARLGTGMAVGGPRASPSPPPLPSVARSCEDET